MTMTLQMRHRWDTLEYHQIATVEYASGDVIVEFGDGARVRVAAGLLLGDGDSAPDWPRARAEEFHIVVPTATGDVEIPWDVIRVNTDPEFDAYWAERVATVRRRTGRRIRRLRLASGMPLTQLATRSGLAVETLSEIESSDRGADAAELDQLLEALGCSLREFGELPDE